jgi:hypothetical protein
VAAAGRALRVPRATTIGTGAVAAGAIEEFLRADARLAARLR